jgi:hypothetical protein
MGWRSIRPAGISGFKVETAVLEFNPKGEVIREVTGEEASGLGEGGHGFFGYEVEVEGLAVDPTNQDLLVALSYGGAGQGHLGQLGAVDEFNSEGAFLGQITEAAGQPLSGAYGLAVDSQGHAYVVNHDRNAGEGSTHAVEEFEAGHFVPGLRPAAATQSTETSAVLNGFVDPESELNPEKEGIIGCHFEYVSEAGFEGNDVNARQTLTLSGATGGVFSLGFGGQSTAVTGTGDLVGPAGGTGVLIAGSNTITGVTVASGTFVAGEEISGVGIPAATTIVSVQPGVLVLSADVTASGGAVVLSAVSDEVSGLEATAGAFAVGDEIAGAGILAGTTITEVGNGRARLSADVTASGSAVALSGGLAYDASAAHVQSALEALSSVGAGDVAVSGANGGPYTVEFKGSLGHTDVAQLTANASGLLPGGATVTPASEAEGGDGWGHATSVSCEDPSAAGIPKNDVYTHVHAEVSEHIESGVTYRYRLAATVGGLLGGSERTPAVAFTAARAPQVSATAASGVTSTFARLSGDVTPFGSDTTYQFQYLNEEQFKANGESFAGAAVVPATPAEVGSGGEAGDLVEAVGEQVGGLAPATTYRFRLVASNGAGVSEGEVAGGGGEVANTFTTEPATSSGLPEGRAYELVTPPDKEGAEDMFRESGGTSLDTGASSWSGDQFVLEARAAFGSFPASGENVYVFSRHPVEGHPEREEWGFTSLASPALGLQNLGTGLGAIEPDDFSASR